MTVLLCISSLRSAGGAERAIIELGSYLISKGYNVFIITFDSKYNNKDDLFYGLNGIDHLNIKESNNLFYRFFRKIYHKTLSSVMIFSRSSKLFYYYNYILINKITLTVNRIQPNVIISFMPKAYKLMSFVGVSLKIPTVSVNRSNPYKQWYYYNDNKINNNIIHSAVDRSTVNIVLDDSFIPYFNNSKKTKTIVIENPIYPILESSLAVPSEDSPSNTILSVGRMVVEKNHRLLILAFSLIAHKYPSWNIKIIGLPHLKQELQSLVNDLSINNRVILLDPVGDIGREYSSAKIFAFPSLFEGWGLALTEAMSYGLPSVVLEGCIPPANHIIRSNGGLLAKNTPTSFANKLEELILSRSKRKKLGKNALAYTKSYHPDKIYRKWISLISSIC